MKKIVENYSILGDLKTFHAKPLGMSVAPKEIVFYIFKNLLDQKKVLDIGFGEGRLGKMIKSNPSTSHWIVDGIDGWEVNCYNSNLIDSRYYRDIYYGLAQDLPSSLLRDYDLICLLDVIEHLDADTAKWLLRTLLNSMGDNAFLFVSSPLWFMPQDSIDSGDLEEHFIGIPATAMMALMPVMYAVNRPLVGGFVLDKMSLDYIDLFHPTSRKSFDYKKGLSVAKSVRMGLESGKIYFHRKLIF